MARGLASGADGSIGSWFILALVNYRGLIGEVLAASLVLQLFALATPLTAIIAMDTD